MINTDTVTRPEIAQGIPGIEGDSAYEVAVAAGFVGDVAAWLASLVGPAGPAGADGSAGAPGADGADGAAGAQGQAGPEGPQGPQGVAGADGAQGPAGADGAQGPQGIQGDPGADGADGAAGAEGPQGIQGIQGPAGADGAVGAEGPTGPEGPQGPQGIQGIQGIQGDPGSGSEAFPVGAVFIAVVSTNPGTLLGYGTWSAFAAGRVLVGIDSGDTDFDTVRETRGSKTHTLTESELPAHTHAVTDPGHTHTTQRFPTATGGSSGFTVDTSMSGTPADNTLATKSATTGITNQNTGSGTAHNNLQPSIVVYMWERTA